MMLSGHASSHDPASSWVRDSNSAASVSFPRATITSGNTGSSDSAGCQRRWGLMCFHVLARRTTYRPWQSPRQNIEQVVVYSCTVRMLLLPRSNFPNVKLGPGQHDDRAGHNARARTSSSLPSRMYPSLRPLCPGRLEIAAYRRPAPN